jgi:hypothetical protein
VDPGRIVTIFLHVLVLPVLSSSCTDHAGLLPKNKEHDFETDSL